MKIRLQRTALAALLATFAVSAWGHGDDDDGPRRGRPEQLGQVDFPVSCNAAAQKEFNRAMALFHSFWFEPAKLAFAHVLEQDPGCGMAHWGTAIMAMGNPFTWPTNPNASRAGAPAAAAAQRTGARSERDRDYIAALGIFFNDWEKAEFRPRAIAFEQAMGALATKYPDDDEAQILYALALNITALPSDKTFANQRIAAAILEPLFRKHPDHPGVAHYLIHTYDYAELATQGLPAARAYGAIAPTVPHALHMPSHIYSRVGLWPEMVSSNRASYLAAKGELSEATLGIGAYDALHAMDYMLFAELQQGRDTAAKAILDEVGSIRVVNVENFPAAYALAAMPARYALERGDWAAAESLALFPSTMNWSRFPHAEAVLVFARGIGAARAGHLDAAREAVDRLQALKAAMAKARMGYWPGQADFQIDAINAWIALAEKRDEEALRLMTAAARSEEATDKHPVTPGNVVPCRELLAEMHMALAQPRSALAEFERSLRRDPNRYRSLAGALEAAAAVGDATSTRAYAARLLAQTASTGSQRPELVLARTLIAGR